MELLYVLEKIRNPWLNELMLLLTKLGEETAFLIAALVVFWCIDKKKGYYVMAVGFIGTLANQFMKLVFRIPRPWVLDSNFTILEQAREASSGYSFPSGHSQSSVGTFGAIAHTTNKRWLKYTCTAICVLVPFSRMYIGVHTPKDVIVGAIMALILVFALGFCAKTDNKVAMKALIAVMLLLSVAFVFYVSFFDFPVDIDQNNLQSAVKNAYTLLGCLIGVAVVYPLERRYVQFPTKAAWWVQILKIILGLAVVLLVKEGFRYPLDLLFNGHMVSRAVRYFLIVVVAGLIWPMTFNRFSLIGEKKV